jgi:hypothetical protein
MSTETNPTNGDPITYKEENKLWMDYDHDWPAESVPRKPPFFQPAPSKNDMMKPHFLDRLADLPGDKERRSSIVARTIKHGEVYPAEDHNRYRFLWNDPRDGRTFSLIVELRAEAFAKEAEKHYAITIYSVE